MTAKKILLVTGSAIFSCFFSAASAQDEDATKVLVVPSPPAATGGAGGASTGFAGYVPSASSLQPHMSDGMVTGGSNVQPLPATRAPISGGPLSDGKQTSPEKIEGFNKSIEQTFPMTPDMLRQYMAIVEEQQRVLLEKPQPQISNSTGLLTLEPGEETPTIYVSPGMFTAIGVYDSTGQAWPITQYVIGNSSFDVIQLGQDSNSITITPKVPLGWTNIALALKGEPKPIILNVEISKSVANARRDIQVMKPGPNAIITPASEMPSIKPVDMPQTEPITREAGSPLLMAALSGVDMPETAKPVSIGGVNAKAWAIGGKLIIRSRYPLASPAWTSSLAGPDGVFVYEIDQKPLALFIVNGQIVRADIDIP